MYKLTRYIILILIVVSCACGCESNTRTQPIANTISVDNVPIAYSVYGRAW